MTEETKNTINKPQKKELSFRDKLYAQALIKHKGNQLRAYEEVYPNHNNHATRKTQALMAKNGAIFNLNKITPSYIIERLDNLALTARKDSDKIACLQLLGRFKALFTDKVQTEGKLELKEPTKQDISEIEELINRFKRGYTAN